MPRASSVPPSPRPSLRASLLLAALAGLGLLPAPPARGDPRPSGVHTDREGARPLPAPRPEETFRFVVFADRTGGSPEGLEVLRRAVKEANLLAPDLVMTVGDLVDGYNGARPWRAQMRAHREVMDRLAMPWYPVAGNHDVTWGGSPAPRGHHEEDYERAYGPLWYSFHHRNAAFLVLYSDEGDPEQNRKGWSEPALTRFSARQLAFLDRALAEARGMDAVFVFLHHPRWRRDLYPGSDWEEVHRRFVAAGNVRVVFAGHTHRERADGTRDGVRYVTLGTTGAGIPFDVPGTGYLHHVCLVTVRGREATLASIPVGSVRDPAEMTPEHLEDVDLLRRMKVEVAGPGLRVTAGGTASGEVRFALANPARRPVRITVAPKAAPRGWWFAPSPALVALGPGERREVALAAGRDTGDGLEGFAVPDLSLAVELLAEEGAVALPARSVPLAWRLEGIPPALLDGSSDRALALPGDGSCLRVEASVLDLPDAPFTVEAWMRADDLSGRRALLAKTEDSEWGLFVSDGRPQFTVWVKYAYVTAAAPTRCLETGTWHHVAGVVDPTGVRLRVDGRLVASRDAAGPRRRSAWPLYVGADPDRGGAPTSGFAGCVDEVRLSSVARYEGTDDVRPARRFEPDEATLLLLHLDGPLGAIAPDATPAGRHALRVGTVTYR